MKNDSHPLIQALKRKSISEPDRLFHITKEDIPMEAKFDPGDNAKFVIHGKVRSTHDDGSMMMHVQKVEHQMVQGNSEPETAPKTSITTTQESSTH